MSQSRRSSFWTRWPDYYEGPLWAELHLHERAGVTAIVGVGVYTEPPGDARSSSRPPYGDFLIDAFPASPASLRAVDVRSLSLPDLLARAQSSGDELAQVHTGSSYGDDHWRRVAQAVRSAEGRGDPTAKAVARTWDVSRPTAKRWIGEARRRGFLEAR